MQITLNGKISEFSKNITISELVKEKNLKPEVIVIEYNKRILKTGEWPGIILKDGDNLEIVSFVVGG